jgi:ATP-dependent helicase/nuclease subunit B
MNDIAKSDEPAVSHPTQLHWLGPQDGLVARIAAALDERGAHASRTMVLVPFAQVIPTARAFWAQALPTGFAPRFETTYSWARSLGALPPAADDITFEVARDGLTARVLLERAGLGAQRDVLAPRLVESAQMLARTVAAVPPAGRAGWAANARVAVSLGLDNPVLALEAAVARIALEWAAASAYPTDVLFDGATTGQLDALVVLQGFQPEPLAEALVSAIAHKSLVLPLVSRPQANTPDAAIRLHAATGPEDEAERAAACVLRHLAAGHAPVALAATDRTLTRRVRAMLEAQGVALRDETGWKLSTTRAAATLMAALRACARTASSDAVLDWLKSAPVFDGDALAQLETAVRQAGIAQWRDVRPQLPVRLEAACQLAEQADALREPLQAARSLPQWLEAVSALLRQAGHWEALAADAAGAMVLATLYIPADEVPIHEPGAGLMPEFSAWLAHTPFTTRRLSAVQFLAWVNEALESASFRPVPDEGASVVILPLHQWPGEPFAAAVLPGSDEVRLAASPEPPGNWTAAQRLALALPSRETLEATLRAAWQHALETPRVDVLWRTHDAGGEPVLPSPLVQALLLQGVPGGGAAGIEVSPGDPREIRQLSPAPTLPPMPLGNMLPVARLSASAYEDLRRCPYRFFALRQLGLREVGELDVEVDKRDFGNWLHAVLKQFHEALQESATTDHVAREALLDDAANAVTAAMHLAQDEFLPFAASWPRLRTGYLQWLAGHEAAGASFRQAERWVEQQIGPLTLVGQIDRLDTVGPVAPQPSVMVMDYKTEALAKSQSRVRDPLEDTQLAFYAALLPDDTLRAAYVNVGERETRTVEQAEVVPARDALIEGILSDMAGIAGGAPLRALGEGSACEFCSARGLCRKDFWEVAA